MSISPLLPFAGAAVGSLAADVTKAVHDSFADVLQKAIAGGQEADLRPPSVQGAAREADHELLEEFRVALLERLAAAGVDLSSPIELQGDGFGRIQVTGGHPQRAVIEQILQEDLALTALFNQLALAASGDSDTEDPVDPFAFSLKVSSTAIHPHFGQAKP